MAVQRPTSVGPEIEHSADKQLVSMFRQLDAEQQAKSIHQLEAKLWKPLVMSVSPERRAAILPHLISQQQAELIGQVSKSDAKEGMTLMRTLSEAKKKEIIVFLQPEEIVSLAAHMEDHEISEIIIQMSEDEAVMVLKLMDENLKKRIKSIRGKFGLTNRVLSDLIREKAAPLITKGIPIRFARRNGELVSGLVISFDNPDQYIVVGKVVENGIANITQKTFTLKELLLQNPGLEAEIEKVRTSEEARNKMISLFEMEKESNAEMVPAAEFIETPTIVDGNKTERLAEGIHTFELPGGIQGAATTAVAGYKYETDTNGATKNRDEDVLVIDSTTGFVCLADAAGSGGNGVRVREIFSKSLMEGQNDTPAAVKKAQKALAESSDIGNSDGITFTALKKIEIGQPLNVHQAGDVELYHFAADGRVKYQPGDHLKQGLKPQSILEYMEGLPSKFSDRQKISGIIGLILEQAKSTLDKTIIHESIERIVDRMLSGEKPFVEGGNPLLKDLRKMTFGVSKRDIGHLIDFKTSEAVEGGDVIMLLSDGATKLFKESGELMDWLKMAVQQGWSSEKIAEELSKILDARTKAKADGESWAEDFSFDNISFSIMKAPKAKGSFKAVEATAA